MPLGNLKAIARLHLSGRASGTPPELLTAAKASDEGGGQERAKRKGKNQPAGTTHFHRANGATAVFTLKGTLNPRALKIFTTRVFL